MSLFAWCNLCIYAPVCLLKFSKINFFILENKGEPPPGHNSVTAYDQVSKLSKQVVNIYL